MVVRLRSDGNNDQIVAELTSGGSTTLNFTDSDQVTVVQFPEDLKEVSNLITREWELIVGGVAGAATVIAPPTGTDQYLRFSSATMRWTTNNASNMAFTPVGNIAGTTVALALAELDAEKAALSGATFSGKIATDDVTDATSTTNGSIQTDGGISAVKAIYAGGRITTDDAADATNSTDGSIQTDGGASIAKRIYVGSDANVAGNLNVSGQIVFPNTMIINGAAGSYREIAFKSGSSLRWDWFVDNTAETGSDAGSNFSLVAYSDAAAPIDTVWSIARAANGTMSISRPMKFTGISTTANAANAYLDPGNGNNLLRSTSSIRYKRDVRDVSLDESSVIYNLRPIIYRSCAPSDDNETTHLGFIAEEVVTVEPRLVHYLNGEPDGVQYERVVVLLVKELQVLRSEIESIKARIQES